MRAPKIERNRTQIVGQCGSVQGRGFDVVPSDLTRGNCRFRDRQLCQSWPDAKPMELSLLSRFSGLTIKRPPHNKLNATLGIFGQGGLTLCQPGQAR